MDLKNNEIHGFGYRKEKRKATKTTLFTRLSILRFYQTVPENGVHFNMFGQISSVGKILFFLFLDTNILHQHCVRFNTWKRNLLITGANSERLIFKRVLPRHCGQTSSSLTIYAIKK